MSRKQYTVQTSGSCIQRQRSYYSDSGVTEVQGAFVALSHILNQFLFVVISQSPSLWKLFIIHLRWKKLAQIHVVLSHQSPFSLISKLYSIQESFSMKDGCWKVLDTSFHLISLLMPISTPSTGLWSWQAQKISFTCKKWAQEFTRLRLYKDNIEAPKLRTMAEKTFSEVCTHTIGIVKII